MQAAGCKKVFSDKKSGKDAEREQLAACLDYMRAGGTLVVASLDGGREQIPDPRRYGRL